MRPRSATTGFDPFLLRFRGRLGRGVALLALCTHLMLGVHFAATPHEHALRGHGWQHVAVVGGCGGVGGEGTHADPEPGTAHAARVDRSIEDGDEQPEAPRPHDDRDCPLVPPALASSTTLPVPPVLPTGRFAEQVVVAVRQLPRTTAPLVDAPKHSPPAPRITVT